MSHREAPLDFYFFSQQEQKQSPCSGGQVDLCTESSLKGVETESGEILGIENCVGEIWERLGKKSLWERIERNRRISVSSGEIWETLVIDYLLLGTPNYVLHFHLTRNHQIHPKEVVCTVRVQILPY